jgi:hypothetical protein
VLHAKGNLKKYPGIFDRDGNSGTGTCVRPIANHKLSRN